MVDAIQLDQLQSLTARPSDELLRKNKYIKLTTYKKNKTPVPTTVWFVWDNSIESPNKMYLTTSKKAGKLKRIAHTKDVAFSFCSASGKVHSEYYKGTARILPDEEILYAHNLLKKKYGVIFKLWATFYLRKNARKYIELVF